MQQEEEAKANGTSNPNKPPSSPGGNSHLSYDEDELIDMDDCPSDSDPEQLA